MEHERDLNPAWLPSGTRVGPWRVLERRGQGSYGAVYRAESAEAPSGPVALKLAVYPRDVRFDREAELLSRIRHPGVPRLIDADDWLRMGIGWHPYLVMEFIEGAPLYDWAREHRPSSRRALQLLAGVARALEAIHAAGGVHRDVKGDNVLVRAADGHVFLTDFGSGSYVGAAPLTWRALPPGTPTYRSPEAWGFILRHSGEECPVPYAAGPSDDVFALGVTGYRLVTGGYPPSADPTEKESRLWRQEGSAPRPPRVLNPRCCPELSALVSRMLHVRPEARGSARELAEALEHAAATVGPEADVPLFDPQAPGSEDERAPAPSAGPRTYGARWRPWLAAVSMGVSLALAVGWGLRVQPGNALAPGQPQPQAEMEDGGTVAVGDTALTAPVASQRAPSVWSITFGEMPPKPLPGQLRPDARGRCPRLSHVPINGGCWLELRVDLKRCDEGYEYKGGCYVPAYPPPRVPTSSPAEPSRDGG